MHDDRVDERIRDVLAGSHDQGPATAERDPVGAVRSRVVRHRRRRRAAAGATALCMVLAAGMFAVLSGSSEPQDLQTAGRGGPAQQPSASSSAEHGEGVVAPECRALAEKPGTRALVSTDPAGLCAVLDMAASEAPTHGAVRFFLDGKPIATVGLEPCPLPEAFAVPSAEGRPLPDGNGHRITGTVPAAAGDVRTALGPITAKSDRVAVDYFPELKASLYVVDQRGATMAATIGEIDAATAPLRSGLSMPECAREDATQAAAGTFPLPASGEAESVLWNDGMPVWVVNHGDGTASAVPALISGASLPNALIAGDRVFNQVLWDPDGAFDVFSPSDVPGKVLSWDDHGRAVTADADLGGFTAVVEGETVRIERVATADVPGRAEPATRSETGVESPQLPPVVPMQGLTPGWHQIEADIVLDSEGNATVCEPVDQTEALGPGTSSTCPPDAPSVARLSLRSSTPGTDIVEARIHSPVVVHVDERLVIDGVFPANGVSAIQR